MIADRWGVTADEVARRYPCDDLTDPSTPAAWRGATVRATPAELWPWIGQIRLAPYSYDWIDNLGRRSPRELRDLLEPRVGERFTRTAGRPIGRILAVDHERALTGRIGGVVMSYVLVPDGSGTRLLLKVVLGGAGVLTPLLSAGDLVMARRQLLTFARLAEATALEAG